MSTPLDELSQLAGEAWLVGGAVRDRLLGRTTGDYDVAVTADARQLARTLARATRAHAFELSEGFGAWRVIAPDRSWQLDLLPLAGETIEEDLGKRDFTVNAVAEPLRGGDHVDPFGGLADLRARRLRMVSPQAFAADPLRSLRLVRLACELDFETDPETAAAARAHAPALAGVAAERIFAEIKRIIVADRALDGLALMDALGVTGAVLPELTRLQGVEQSRYHHLDVHQHTRAVLAETIELERDPERWLGEHAQAVAELLSEPLANELTRRPGASVRGPFPRRRQAADAQRNVRGSGHLHGPRCRRRGSRGRGADALEGQRAPARPRRGAHPSSPASRLPRPRDAAESPCRVPLPARHASPSRLTSRC